MAMTQRSPPKLTSRKNITNHKKKKYFEMYYYYFYYTLIYCIIVYSFLASAIKKIIIQSKV